MSEQQRERSFAFDWSLERWSAIGKSVAWVSLALLVVNVWNYAVVHDRDLGSVGDFFGGVLTPLLTFLTFVALLQSIHLQREELEATRKELAASAQAQKEQAEYMKQQQDHLDRKDSMDKIIYMNGMISDITKQLIRASCDDYLISILKSKNLNNNELTFLINYFSLYIDVKYSIILIKEMIVISGGDYFLELMVVRYFDLDICNFLQLYYESSSIHGGICDATTKDHLKEIVAFLEKHGRLTQPTP